MSARQWSPVILHPGTLHHVAFIAIDFRVSGKCKVRDMLYRSLTVCCTRQQKNGVFKLEKVKALEPHRIQCNVQSNLPSSAYAKQSCLRLPSLHRGPSKGPGGKAWPWYALMILSAFWRAGLDAGPVKHDQNPWQSSWLQTQEISKSDLPHIQIIMLIIYIYNVVYIPFTSEMLLDLDTDGVSGRGLCH